MLACHRMPTHVTNNLQCRLLALRLQTVSRPRVLDQSFTRRLAPDEPLPAKQAMLGRNCPDLGLKSKAFCCFGLAVNALAIGWPFIERKITSAE
jgi:hypothetical protein